MMTFEQRMKKLQEQLEKAAAFFSPENLARKNLACSDIALLVIDTQKLFCDPAYSTRASMGTKIVAERIKRLTEEFRKAGIAVYAVYSGPQTDNLQEMGFYAFTPKSGDRLIAKHTNSAFRGRGNQTRKTLEKDGKKLLLACGFNLSACVLETVVDARKRGFDVCVMHDLCGNDNDNCDLDSSQHVAQMNKSGAMVDTSANVLKNIRAARLKR